MATYWYDPELDRDDPTVERRLRLSAYFASLSRKYQDQQTPAPPVHQLSDLVPTGSGSHFTAPNYQCPKCGCKIVRRLTDDTSVESVVLGAVYQCANCQEDPPEFSAFVGVGR